MLRIELAEGSLELQRPTHVPPVAKTRDDLIALRRAQGALARFEIELGELESPLVAQVVPRHLLEDRDPLVNAHVLLLVELVLEDVAVRVPGRDVDIFIVKLQGSHKVAQLQFEFTE